MNRSVRRSPIAAIAVILGLAVSLAPAAADQVLTLASHRDAMTIMGKTTPAKDETHTYWFGDTATRYDLGDTSIIMRVDAKKLYFIDHTTKTYSPIDLPFDFASLAGPEMKQAMEMMAKQMTPTVTVTPSDRTGSFAGVACNYATVNIKMMMMDMTMDSCNAESLPIDYTRYKDLQDSFSQLMPNQAWIKEMAEKIKGFPIRQDMTMNVMGSPMKNWSELKSVEEKPAPAGIYDPPAGYKEQKYDPMAQAQRRRG
jgi:hypothetical protein